jgi:hypothetical protein
MAGPIPALMMAALLVTSHGSAFTIRGSVIASGGLSSTPATNAAHQVVGTAGQPAIDTGAGVTRSGFWRFIGLPVAMDPPGSDVPGVFSFVLVSSNPARGPAQLELALPRSSRITLRVFDVTGRQIGNPLVQRFEAGRHRLTWGTDLRHSGLYFIRLTSEAGFEATRKIVLVR